MRASVGGPRRGNPPVGASTWDGGNTLRYSALALQDEDREAGSPQMPDHAAFIAAGRFDADAGDAGSAEINHWRDASHRIPVWHIVFLDTQASITRNTHQI